MEGLWEGLEFETWPDGAKCKIKIRKLLLKAEIESTIIPAYENSFKIQIKANPTEI